MNRIPALLWLFIIPVTILAYITATLHELYLEKIRRKKDKDGWKILNKIIKMEIKIDKRIKKRKIFLEKL